jgi:hypothetical protein
VDSLEVGLLEVAAVAQAAVEVVVGDLDSDWGSDLSLEGLDLDSAGDSGSNLAEQVLLLMEG